MEVIKVPRGFEIPELNMKIIKTPKGYKIEGGIVSVKVGSFICPATGGIYSVTGVPFKPRYVEFMVSRMCGVDVYAGIGWADYNANQKAIAWTHDADGQSASYFLTYGCICVINKTGNTYIINAGIISMNDDGFTVNFGNVDTSFTIGWKAVK